MNKDKEDHWRQFVKQCLQFKNEKELSIFFDIFLTISEKEEIGKRLLIVKELLFGEKTQRKIAKDLQVSIANVSRGSNTIKTYKENLKNICLYNNRN